MKQARDRFGALVDEARRHEPVVVTKHGRPVATVMDYEAAANRGDTGAASVRKGPVVAAFAKVNRRSSSRRGRGPDPSQGFI